ncbi:hypothetical protein BV898_13897 [Hypsibius exemplaris]|uniref:L antigen family member 3 n=1 Tax=Hypsibius exemplaris TaxID=2072580 RepID=A0A1W0W9F0_HYPEX|nr:hypothetical protein BV898_13897 [Hypsibius exemplaris]
MSCASAFDATLTIEIPFPSSEIAEIVFRTLSVDREPPRGNVRKELALSGNTLTAVLIARDPKNLRTAANKFLDYVKLTVDTINRFG